MNLNDLVQRTLPPAAWAEGDNIPWNDPGFSERMLRWHFPQEHDSASRRPSKIEQQVAWIHVHLLGGQPTRLLELGCGPGHYTSRLARLGHTCVGIDFSPASIAYARAQAEREGLTCRYELQDMRQADLGRGLGLVMLLYGDFNVFCPADARLVLRAAWDALDEGGALLLEPSTYDSVRQMAEERSWYSAHTGLFSDRPHLALEESFWDETQHVTTRRHYIIDAASAEVQHYALSYQAYTEDDYRRVLNECGFRDVAFYPSLIGEPDATQSGFLAILARK